MSDSIIVDQVVAMALHIKSVTNNEQGDDIPSDRSLVKSLGFARGTIRGSLAVLTFLGYIRTVKAKGRYIKAPINIDDITKKGRMIYEIPRVSKEKPVSI